MTVDTNVYSNGDDEHIYINSEWRFILGKNYDAIAVEHFFNGLWCGVKTGFVETVLIDAYNLGKRVNL